MNDESGSRGGSASESKQFGQIVDPVAIIDDDITAADRETINTVVKELDDITLGGKIGGMIEDYDENL